MAQLVTDAVSDSFGCCTHPKKVSARNKLCTFFIPCIQCIIMHVGVTFSLAETFESFNHHQDS
jgi:hypothetical protein